jgi:hypothetical protein
MLGWAVVLGLVNSKLFFRSGMLSGSLFCFIDTRAILRGSRVFLLTS